MKNQNGELENFSADEMSFSSTLKISSTNIIFGKKVKRESLI
jgi:hypothetical protein